MKTQEFYNYAFDAIFQSILAYDYDRDGLMKYYGDSKKCKIESYFGSQIKGESLYSQVDEQTADTLLISDIKEYADIFELARQEAYAKWENMQF